MLPHVVRWNAVAVGETLRGTACEASALTPAMILENGWRIVSRHFERAGGLPSSLREAGRAARRSRRRWRRTRRSSGPARSIRVRSMPLRRLALYERAF